jgi:anti-sigma-K factor RskA
MTENPILPRDEHDLLAAEYVLGVLDLSERTAAETRLRNDPAFAQRVASWENHFSGLNDEYALAPAPDLMPQIEARLFPQTPKRSVFGNLWAWGAAASAAVAVVAYLALTPPSPSLTATLAADASPLRFEAVVTQDRLTITRVAGDAAGSTVAQELWIIVGDNPPVSLGLIDQAQEVISLPGVAAGALLAVSQEPPGGSPTGQPTGPILVTGVLTAT